MSLISIDDSKCKRDGLCVKECPVAIIKLKDKESLPVMISRGPKMCLLCGHCVAVCPHDALQHKDIPMESSPAISKDLSVNEDQAVQFLRTRRSIRRFKQKTVDKETVQFLIDTARYAPTGSNSQLISWTVHNEPEKVNHLAELTIEWMRQTETFSSGTNLTSYLPMIVAAYDAGVNSITHNAPCIVFASTPGIYENGMVDLSIALTYFELIAAAKGLGTCWLGLITRALKHYEPLQKAVGLPESHTHFYPMVLGYPKFKYHRVPERKPAQIQWK